MKMFLRTLKRCKSFKNLLILNGNRFHGQEKNDLEETDDEIFSDTDTSIDLDISGVKSHAEVSDASSSPSAVLIAAAHETLETPKITEPYRRPREVRPLVRRNKPQRLGNAVLGRFRRYYKKRSNKAAPVKSDASHDPRIERPRPSGRAGTSSGKKPREPIYVPLTIHSSAAKKPREAVHMPSIAQLKSPRTSRPESPRITKSTRKSWHTPRPLKSPRKSYHKSPLKSPRISPGHELLLKSFTS